MGSSNMESSDCFPRYLLKRSNDERREYFTNYTVAHPRLVQICEEILWAIYDSLPGTIILLYGATGVGKSTVLRGVEKVLIENALPDLQRDPGRLPVVKIHIKSPESGSFDWKEYFKLLLTILEEPLVDRKIDLSQWIVEHNKNMQLIGTEKPSRSRFRDAAETTLLHRKPKAVLIDDAQHFGVISSGRKLLDQLNTIKSVADQSKVTHVLAGTFDLVPFRNLNGQLSRRSIDIHFKRYMADSEEDRQAFINVLGTFQQQLPLIEMPNLVSEWDYFYERSIGCVGVLKDWLSRALALALREGQKTITREHLDRRALKLEQCKKMLSEAAMFEKELEESEATHLQLREDIGLDKKPKSNKSATLPSQAEKQGTGKKPRRDGRVGQRAAVRDKVGSKAA
jgi:energy-coupling factor transporter ATP-binding protein EcfA2